MRKLGVYVGALSIKFVITGFLGLVQVSVVGHYGFSSMYPCVRSSLIR